MIVWSRKTDTNIFEIWKKIRRILSQRSNKRQREEMEDQKQAVLVSQASTATITGKRVNTKPNLLPPFSTQTYHHNNDTLAIKFNRLKDTLCIKIFYLSALTTNFVLKILEHLTLQTITKFLSIIGTPS